MSEQPTRARPAVAAAPGRGPAAADGASRLDRVVGAVSRLGATIATIGLVAIMLTATIDVASRNLWGTSVPGIIESAEMTLVGCAFLGLAWAQRGKSHVAATVLIDRMPRAAARVLAAFGLAALAVYVGLAAWVSGSRALASFASGEVRFGLMQIPQWPARAAICAGFVLLLLEVVRDLVRAVRGGADGTPGRDGRG